MSNDPPVSVDAARLPEGDPRDVVVPDRLVLPGVEVVDCPAAPLLSGWLRRAGQMVRSGTVEAVTTTGRREAQVFYSVIRRPHRADAGHVTAGIALATGSTRDTARHAEAALTDWARVLGPRTVLLAGPRSFCAGVQRAVEVVENLLERKRSPVFVRKQIVHNTHMVNSLERRGAVFVEDLDEVPEGETVVFSAHGVSPAVHQQAAERSLGVVDAACPLVTKVHAEARRFADRGDTVILIGHAGHQEVEGIMGHAPEHTVLVQNAEEAALVEVPDPGRVTYLTQTTLAVDETAEVIAVLRERFPELRGPASEDICYATTNRQRAVGAIAEESDLMLVIGSGNSSNSLRLVELADRGGTPAYRIEDASDIRPEWLDGVGTVGLTAGASSPQNLVDEVIGALGGLGAVTVEERVVTTEDVHFAPPRAVRNL